MPQLELSDTRAPWILPVTFTSDGILRSAVLDWRPQTPGGDGWTLGLRAVEGEYVLAPRQVRAGIDFWSPFRAFLIQRFGAHLRLDILGQPTAAAGLRVQCSVTLTIEAAAPGEAAASIALSLGGEVR